MKRKILLPTDFSERAWQAVNYALNLYKKDDCEFYILNVFSAKESLLNTESKLKFIEKAKQKSEQGLVEVLEALRFVINFNMKHHFEIISVCSNPMDAIKKVVQEKHIDLIVMGTKGQTNCKSTIYGHVTTAAMAQVHNCAVIAVPDTLKQKLPEKALAPFQSKSHFKKYATRHFIEN